MFKQLLAALLLTVCSVSLAGIGTVTETQGTACEIHRNKAKMTGVRGSDVESMDTYVTAKCVAGITFRDDTKVKVAENSRLLIDDFVYDPKKSDAGKLALKVGAGTVRYASGQIAKNNPQAVDVKTPTASIAVRGTDFSMTVSEDGESLVVLLPSCKHESEQKRHELDEQRCKVGKIDVTNGAGTVSLDRAFEATYVASTTSSPTVPIVVNIVESKIGNNLILIKPQEVQRVIKESKKTKKDAENDALESDAVNQVVQGKSQSAEGGESSAIKLDDETVSKRCDPSRSICVRWEKDGSSMAERGRGTAIRQTPNEHYVEIKTQGFASNTTITVIQNDTVATEILGDGSPGGNTVIVKQNNGVLKR